MAREHFLFVIPFLEGSDTTLPPRDYGERLWPTAVRRSIVNLELSHCACRDHCRYFEGNDLIILVHCHLQALLAQAAGDIDAVLANAGLERFSEAFATYGIEHLADLREVSK